MSRTTYAVKLTFDTLMVSADLVEASAAIQVLNDDGGDEVVIPTPYQTADANHRERRMAILAVKAMGSEYWQDPSVDYDDMDEDEAIESLIVSIREV